MCSTKSSGRTCITNPPAPTECPGRRSSACISIATMAKTDGRCRSRQTRPFTFRVSRRPREMYCGHARLSVCLSAAAFPHYCTDPDVTWGSGRGCPLLCTIGRICNPCAGCVAMATLWKCVAEPIGNPPGSAHAARSTHARTSDKIDTTRLLRVHRYLRRSRSISSILRPCCNANAKC